MAVSSEWIEFEARGKHCRAQFAETGLVIEALRQVCAKPRNMFNPPTKQDWPPSEPAQWDPVSLLCRNDNEVLHAIESVVGVRGREEYARRKRYARSNTVRCEKQAEAWISSRPSITVAQGRILSDASYEIIDAGAWLQFPYETVERLYWHKRELAAWKDPAAVYAPCWFDMKAWLLWALKLSRRPERFKLWRQAVAKVEILQDG